MRAVTVQENRIQLGSSLPRPRPKKGEALIRTRLAGICGTDLEIIRGYSAFAGVLGHEFVGTVEEAPGGQDRVGDRVVGKINIGCRRCRFCRQGLQNHCQDRRVLGIRGRDGAFAEFFTLPWENLRQVPESVTDQKAVFTEPLAAALRILQQVELGSDQQIAVVGAGKLGQLIGRVLAAEGLYAKVICRYPTQVEALQKAGLTAASKSDLAPDSWDVVIDSTGSSQGLASSLKLVRPLGTVVLKSTHNETRGIHLASAVVKEITIVGSRCGPFEPALQLLESGRIDTEPLVEAVFPLQEAKAAFDLAAAPGALKVLVRF